VNVPSRRQEVWGSTRHRRRCCRQLLNEIVTHNVDISQDARESTKTRNRLTENETQRKTASNVFLG
jgi:hypothetical protein